MHKYWTCNEGYFVYMSTAEILHSFKALLCFVAQWVWLEVWWWTDWTQDSEAQWNECVMAERLLSVFSCSWNVPLCVRARYITAACGGRMRILCLSSHPAFFVGASFSDLWRCCMCVPGFSLNAPFQLCSQLLMPLSPRVGGCWKSFKSDSYVWGNTGTLSFLRRKKQKKNEKAFYVWTPPSSVCIF